MICAVPALATLLSLSATDTWAIVDVDAADAMMGLGAQVTRQLVEGATTMGLSVLSGDQLRAAVPVEKYAALRKCRDSAACVAQALTGTTITRVVTGSLNRDEKHYLLKLWHHDVKAGTLVCDVDRAVLIASRRLQKDVEQAVPPLLRGEREARGTLTIESNVPTASITVNGEFVGTPPTTVTLKPGKHEVKVEKPKYLSSARLVDVEANQTKTESFKLLLIPGQTPDLEPLAPNANVATAEAASPSLSAFTFIAGGLTIATGAAAVIFGVLARTQETSLLAGFDANTNVYQGTRAQALEQNRNATLANIGFIAVGAFAIATVVSLIIDLTRPTGATP